MPRSVALLALLLSALPAVCAVPVHDYSAFSYPLSEVRLARFTGPLPTFAYGPTASFDNPAQLTGLQGHEIAVSGHDLQNPYSAAIGYNGTLSRNASFGLGSYYFKRNGTRENRSILSFSSAGPDLDFGANVKLMSANRHPAGVWNKTLFTLDFDAGVMRTFFDRFYAGGAIFNLLSYDFVSRIDSTRIYAERAVKLQLGGSPDPQKRVVLFVEGRVDSLHDLSLSRYAWGAGGEMAFLEGRFLRVRAGFLSSVTPASADPENSLLAGVSGGIPLRGSQLRAEYGIRYPFAGTGASVSPVHHALLALTIGSERDETPPVASVKVDNIAFSPNNDGRADSTTFFITAEDNVRGTGIKKWALSIYQKTHENRFTVIKVFSGTGIPPRAVAWDGRDAGHTILPAGEYYYQFRVVDKAHNYTDTRPQPLIIK
ncbi:MAG: hypothetical protein V1913_03095 [Fibrobacterota bacterium]